jgi:uncharacterized protein (DUF2235 family)
MTRNLVICCDGTNNQFGIENTNVVRLVQSLVSDPERQLVYYDPGIGTLPEPGWVTKVGKKISEIFDLAFATGLNHKVEEAYTFLMDYWQPGDQVFLFGFSRGAYTVRVLAALLHGLGALPRGGDNLVPYVTRLFGGVDQKKYWDLSQEFRWTFARPLSTGDGQKRFPIHLIGVWDTVSSVGWVWDPKSFPFAKANPSVSIVRHAVSIDERRAFFRQNRFGAVAGQDLKEHWFAGVHCDVGGGYPEEEGGLWRTPFEWMLTEARSAGLLVDDVRLQRVLGKTAASASPWDDDQHESLTAKWLIAEYFPKLHFDDATRTHTLRLNLGRHRYVQDGALVHASALKRIREKGSYRPPNFSEHFIRKVIALPSVPEALPYESSPASATGGISVPAQESR